MANFTSTHTGSVVDAAVTKITATSSSATELNILDGVTATTAEINILDGVTATTAEINILDGVTATAAEINILDGVTSTTAELNILDGVTSTAAELNILDGVTSTAAELNVLDGYTGSVTELNYLDTLHATGVTATEFDYLDGVTSNIQTQLDAKIEATLTSEQVQDIVGAMFSSNTESGITVTYEDGDGTIDLTVATQSDNNFTTTLLNKLNAIEASADVTDTTNVTSAGALMDSEVSNLSFVKGLTKGISDGNVLTANDAVADNDFLRIDGTEVEGRTAAEVRSDLNVEDGATADQTASEIKTLVGNASDSNVFTDADHSKLDGIEASADVTDATNVTAAGALMDSELTSIADVKALDQSVISGASPTFGTANMTDASNKRFMTDAQETKLDSVESNATADQTDEEIQDIVGAMFSSNTETGITATYQDADGTIDLVVGTLNQDTTGTASKVTVADSTANTNFPVVFHDEGTGNVLLDDTGALRYNPSTGELLVPKLTVAGTTTQVDTVTMEAANAIIFEGATADAHETTLSIVDPTADHTQYLINQGGYIPVLAAATTTAITSTPAELNVLDGITSSTAELNILDGVTATAAELNIMDGVTATTAELNYVDGVTSNIQTQLDATLDTAGTGIDISSTTISVDVSDFMSNGANNYVLTATGTDAMNAEANLTFDGTHLYLPDSSNIKFGDSQDLEIKHDGSNSIIKADGTGDLTIRQDTADKDILLRCDDGSGGIATYLTLDGSATRTNVHKDLRLDNSVNLQLGGGGDMSMSHDGSNAIFSNAVGNLTIQTSTDDGDVILKSDDGSGGTTAYITLDGSITKTTFNQDVRVVDSKEIGFGNGDDLQIYHDGSHNYIDLNNGNLYFRDDADNNIFIVYREGGGIQLAEGDLKIPATSKLYLDGGGNTYIFEESADNVIHYVGGQNKLRFNSTGTILNDAGLALDFRVEGDTDPNLFFVDGSADRVGIGTTSPSVKLHINDNDVLIGNNSSGYATLNFHSESTGSARYASIMKNYDSPFDMRIRASNSTSEAPLVFDGDSNTEYARFDTSGNFGIGTASPSVELHVKDASSHAQLRIETDSASHGAYLELESTTNKYQIYNVGGDLGIDESGVATRFIIKDSTGNIGIGTSSPVAKLDIENSTAPTLDNNTHAGEALFLRSGGSGGDGNVQAVLAFGKADGSSRRSGSAIASVQTDSDVDKVGIGFYTSDSSSSSQTMDQRVLIDHVGNMRFSDNGANPSASTNMAFIFNDGGEMKVLDELGNTTTISPHNFELIPEGASEDMAFAYHSTKHTPEGKLKKVNVDMMKLARLVEQLTGEKLVYIEEGEKDG